MESEHTSHAATQPMDADEPQAPAAPAAPAAEPAPAAEAPAAAPAAADAPAAGTGPAEPEWRSRLREMYAQLDRRPLQLSSARQNIQFLPFSVFTPALPAPVAQERLRYLIDDAVRSSAVLDSAVGSLVALALCDSLGHPLEFVDVDESLPPYTPRRPHLTAELLRGQPKYHSEYNRFDLLPGQWTDDASMALCMADSLLVHGKCHPADMRLRWFNWWFGGYNNAFRFADPPRGSCGLGGNIAKSLEEVYYHKQRVPAEFSGEGEDAGNGSIMRLAPVPLMYHHDVAVAEAASVRQSKATHPGNDASACCRFLTYFIIKAMHARASPDAAIPDVPAFVDATVQEFMATHPETDSGMQKLHRLLRSAEPAGSTERNWNWRDEKLHINDTMELRAKGPRGKYNGYPVIPSYFGSYCMDGLAMALWAVSRTTTFHDAALAAVNLLGDADTVGAIAGQMAGAIYGYTAIKAREVSNSWLECLYRWDRNLEIPLRALLLATVQPSDSTVPKPEAA